MTVERLATERKVKSVGGIMPQEADMFSGNSDLTPLGLERRIKFFALAVRAEAIREDGLLLNGDMISQYVDPLGNINTPGLLLALGTEIGQGLVDRIEDYQATPAPAKVDHWSARCEKARNKRPQKERPHRWVDQKAIGIQRERGHGRYR
jgi:hypothetical protein